MEDYLEVNRKSWNARLDAHVKSDFYDLDGFMKGHTSLKEIELDLLGDIKGKSILHLQCHFGQDTISLSRLGAEAVGIDLSDKSIEMAKDLAQQTGTSARFECSDVYSLPEVLDEKFDIVFTTYGTISWLPDLDKWAAVVSHFLKPGGKFVFAEFHPVVWMYDDAMEKLAYSYNNTEAFVEEGVATYADENAVITEKCIFWNHGIGEVINSLIGQGLTIDGLREYDYAPYPFVDSSIEFEPGKFRIKNFGDKVPLVYSLGATKQ